MDVYCANQTPPYDYCKVDQVAGPPFYYNAYCCTFHPTSTPTPTPTPITCSSFNNCGACIASVIAGGPANCGWRNGTTCQAGTSSCPAGATSWNWSDCAVNVCAPTPTPPPSSCQVTTFPSVLNLTVGGATGQIQANVTSGLGSATVNRIDFGSYNVARATVNPTSDTTFTYITNVTGQSQGTTEVWATAFLSDGRQCPTSLATNTNVNVSGPTPTPTPTGGPPTPTPTGAPTPTPAPPTGYIATLEQCNALGTAWVPLTNVCVFPSLCAPTPTPTPTSIPTPTPTIPSGSTPTPTPTPALYSISGKIFNDVNGDQSSSGDSNYTGAITITRSPTSGSYSSPVGTGIYSFNNLPAGQYTITFSGLPQGFTFTFPPSPLTVQVGAGCSVPVTSEATCNGSNSIVSLNAGVTPNAASWFQSIGADIRWDSGFANTMPAGKFASLPGSGGMPGIIFSGAITPSFGAGSASITNWQVSGSSVDRRDVYTDTHSLIPSSYSSLLETAQTSGITPIDISTQCTGGITNCALNTSLLNGVYIAQGDLYLNGSGYTFPGGKNFIILINGDLFINEKIIVPVGSTVIFSAKGDITVSESIGEAATSTSPTIEGVYSADYNFITDIDGNNCPTADLRLNIEGSVIANAGRGGGTFINNRHLCDINASDPSVSFIERPDFILNYPSFIKQRVRIWQEVAP
jgi:hypothetical protein